MNAPAYIKAAHAVTQDQIDYGCTHGENKLGGARARADPAVASHVPYSLP